MGAGKLPPCWKTGVNCAPLLLSSLAHLVLAVCFYNFAHYASRPLEDAVFLSFLSPYGSVPPPLRFFSISFLWHLCLLKRETSLAERTVHTWENSFCWKGDQRFGRKCLVRPLGLGKYNSLSNSTCSRILNGIHLLEDYLHLKDFLQKVFQGNPFLAELCSRVDMRLHEIIVQRTVGVLAKPRMLDVRDRNTKQHNR